MERVFTMSHRSHLTITSLEANFHRPIAQRKGTSGLAPTVALTTHTKRHLRFSQTTHSRGIRQGSCLPRAAVTEAFGDGHPSGETDPVAALDRIAALCAGRNRRTVKLEPRDLEELSQTMQSLTASAGSLDGCSVASIACSCAQIAKARVGDQQQQIELLQSMAIQTPKLAGSNALLPADMVRIMWALATSRQHSRHFWADMEQPLINALDDDAFPGKDLALVSWSYARAGSRSKAVFGAVEAKVQQITTDGNWCTEAPLSPRDTSMLMWAFSTNGFPAPILCEAIAPLLVAQAPAFSPRDVAVVLWGLSTVAPQAVQARVLEALEQKIIDSRQQFTDRGLGILLLGLGRSQHGSEMLWRELADEVLERDGRLRPRELVAIASSFAKSGHGTDPLYDHLEAWLMKNGTQLKPHELAMSLWAFATARPGTTSLQNLLEELSPHLLASASRLDARSCPQVLWACAQARRCPSDIVLELLGCSIGLAPSLTLQGVSMTLQAARAVKKAANVNDSLPAGLLAALGSRVTEMKQLQLLEDQRALAGALLGFAHLQHPCPETFGCLLDAARLLSSDLEARNLANILWAAAASQHHSSELFSALEPVTISRSEEFVPAGLCQCVWAYATAGRRAPALFGTLELAFVQQKDSCSLGELAQAVWAFAKAGEDGRRILEAADEKVRDAGCQDIEPSSMAMLVWAVATHDRMWGFEDRQWPGALIAAVEEQLSEKTSSVGAGELAISARSLAATGRSWSPQLAAAVAERALELQDSLEPQDISNLLWSFARIKAFHPGVFDAMDAAIARGASQFSCQGIANSVWAFGRAGHVPSQALVEATSAFLCTNAADFKPEEARMTLSGYRQMHLSVPGPAAALLSKSAYSNEDVSPTRREALIGFKDAGSWYE